MARKITAYACDFKCGRRASTSKKGVELHEKTCFNNPIRRACITCANFESYQDSNGMEHEPQNLDTWRHTACLASDNIDISEKLNHDCKEWVKK